MITLYGTPDNPMGDWIRRAIAAIEKYSAEIEAAKGRKRPKGRRPERKSD